MPPAPRSSPGVPFAAVGLAACLWPFVYTFGPITTPSGFVLVSWQRWLLLVGVVEAMRVLRGHRPLLAHTLGWGRRLWSMEGTRWVAAAWFGSRVIVLAVAVLTTVIVGVPEDKPVLAGSRVLSVQARWDAFWYLNIAAHGYEWDPELRTQQNVAFFPAFPVLMRVGGEMVTIPAHIAKDGAWLGTTGYTRILFGGTLVSVSAFGIALLGLYRIARLDLDQQRARWSVAFACCWPFGVFFSAAYTEALFMAGLVGAFLAFRRARFVEAAGWGVLLGLTRPNGFLVSVALVVLAWESRDRLPRWSWPAVRPVAAIVAPIVGLMIHMGFLWWTIDAPLAWSDAQSEWGRSLGVTTLVETRWRHLLETGGVGYLRAYPAEALNTSMLVGALALGWKARRLAWSYAVLVVALLLPAMAVDLPSLGRMTTALFPLPLVMAMAVPARARLPVASCLFVVQLVVAALFYAWKPMN